MTTMRRTKLTLSKQTIRLLSDPVRRRDLDVVGKSNQHTCKEEDGGGGPKK